MCREGNVAQTYLSKKSLEWALENRQTQCLRREKMDEGPLGTGIRLLPSYLKFL